MSAAPEAYMVDNVLLDALSSLAAVQALIELGADGTLVFTPTQLVALDTVIQTTKTMSAHYGAMLALVELADSHGKQRACASQARAVPNERRCPPIRRPRKAGRSPK